MNLTSPISRLTSHLSAIAPELLLQDLALPLQSSSMSLDPPGDG
jgi:hypothetical protein